MSDQQRPATTSKRPLSQPDPRGRLDVLALKMLERTIEQSQNPVLQTLHETYKDDLTNLAQHYLAPRDRRGRVKRR